MYFMPEISDGLQVLPSALSQFPLSCATSGIVLAEESTVSQPCLGFVVGNGTGRKLDYLEILFQRGSTASKRCS
jgi:hypothetical protein